MAVAVYFGSETGTCPDPDSLGCRHPIAIHNDRLGCSFQSGNWCFCYFKPKRIGVRKLLEQVVEAQGSRLQHFSEASWPG